MVTEVPMLAPIMTGIAMPTVKTINSKFNQKFLFCLQNQIIIYIILPFAPTMLTIMEVEVEELKTRTVTKIPIINPTAG